MTSSEWTKAMTAIIKQMTTMTDKGKLRDFAWNTVLWGSFSTTVQAPDRYDEITKRTQPGGSLEFYANADSDILFGEREVISVNFGNKNGVCSPSTKTSAHFDTGSKSFIVSFKVCNEGEVCTYNPSDYCVDSNDETSVKKKDILHPSQFGYRFGGTENTDFDIKIDTRTLTTALAVNMGMISVSDLEEISKEDELEEFKRQLIKRKILSNTEAQNLRAFYDHIYSPMVPTYCMIYPDALPAQESVFGVADDDSRFASASDLISDDQIPTFAPTFEPTRQPLSPTTVKEVKEETEYIVAFDLTYAPLDANKILSNLNCYNYAYGISSVPCAEYVYLNDTVKVCFIYFHL